MQDPKTLLPHREPFLFVDRIEKADKDGIVGYRRFPADEAFFAGHFPGYPVVPGVILIETMAQVGGAGLRIIDPDRPEIYYFATLDKVRFRRQVRPGEEVRVEVTLLRNGKTAVKQAGRAYVGSELAAEAEWMCLSG
jgi:3-hydroxyacyl-[acyl-carrier-protein] dehydratase